jgi:flavin-dependent dehydrogenase
MPAVEIIVIGGGPAGCAAALALARAGRLVLVVERSRYQAWRIGENLPPRARPLLDAMDLFERMDAHQQTPSRAIHHAWGSAELQVDEHLLNPHGAGWHLDRRRFDALLADGAEAAGARVLRGRAPRSLRRGSAGWRLELDGEAFTAPIVVDASGRSAWAARAAGARWLAHDRLVGLTAQLDPAGDATAGPHLLLEAVADGWWYSVSQPDGSLIATYMTDQEALRSVPAGRLWQAQLDRSTHTAARAAPFTRRGAVRVRSAASGRLDRAAAEDWIAVGDAAAAYDPLSADGIYKALRGGLDAARCIVEGAPFAGHHDEVARSFAAYLQQRSDYYHREQRWPRSPFWRRRQPPDSRALALTLDPSHRLAWRGDSETIDLEGLLPCDGVGRLCALCGTGATAHEVVAEFQRASTVDDRSVIVALQLLRDRGVLADVSV